jgi:hypothetical protein
MNKLLSVMALTVVLMLTLGDAPQGKIKCCRGCGLYGCNHDNGGTTCRKDCVR